ncbi:MAG: biotin--[acetyl-CoA-carboxylase] ligase [Leptospiraceae bacterium]|nr:biotin--[acetyl-CoA-carboxylase] ligase [Leptospiraceae bacterium]
MKRILLRIESGIELEAVTSTNEYLRNSSIPNGFWVSARNQTSGKGRKDHSWSSLGEGNLFFSCKLSLPDIKFRIELLPIFIGLSVFESVIFFFPNLEDKLSLKWPNDLYIENKKLSGVLVELFTVEEFTTILIGIGLNFYSEKDQDKTIFGTLMDEKPSAEFRKQFIAKIINEINGIFQLTSTEAISKLNKANSISYLKNKSIQMTYDEKLIQGKVLEITEKGYLKIDTGNQILELIDTSSDFKVVDNE